MATYGPQLSYCLSIQNRTHAYLDKGKALVLSKLERATAMRPLSELRVSGWILKRCLATKLQHPIERIRLSVPRCSVCSFTHRGVSRGTKNIPHRLRFTRALLQSKDFSMWFCLSLSVCFPKLRPSSGKTAPEKISPRTAFSPSLGSALHRRLRERASCRQEEAPSWPVFGSLYLEGMG